MSTKLINKRAVLFIAFILVLGFSSSTKIVVATINGYQEYISPYKGFRCAYGALHNSSGCSGIIKGIVKEKGLIEGSNMVINQINLCKEAAKSLPLGTNACFCGIDPFMPRDPRRW